MCPNNRPDTIIVQTIVEGTFLSLQLFFVSQIMMDFEISVFEFILLASSTMTIRGGLSSWWPSSWWPINAVFHAMIAQSTLYAYDDRDDSFYLLNLDLLEKAFALRFALVVATLFHEMGHLIAAAAICNQHFRTLFTYQNMLGNIDSLAWIYALVPFFPWPKAAANPYVDLHVQLSSRAECIVRLAAPTASILLAIMCTWFAIHRDPSSQAAVLALGAWIIALGGIASDLLSPAPSSGKRGRFRCGNFGMLVICAMDKYGILLSCIRSQLSIRF
jgi:hypothetical protein